MANVRTCTISTHRVERKRRTVCSPFRPEKMAALSWLDRHAEPGTETRVSLTIWTSRSSSWARTGLNYGATRYLCTRQGDFPPLTPTVGLSTFVAMWCAPTLPNVLHGLRSRSSRVQDAQPTCSKSHPQKQLSPGLSNVFIELTVGATKLENMLRSLAFVPGFVFSRGTTWTLRSPRQEDEVEHLLSLAEVQRQ